ncbi:N-acetylmuramoyl-L-alanine amidase [Bartonella sp. F02]|uniref:N-acetylmuramoyl-L-alanine amidase n=1 Tax=Bartonella sp. F02 TaxID=2967262 RepID=UPI0022A9275D|nr:N-acetylmuramoyl-L-alanine amidase [Bartonella sp. F02]MCZ2328763.1 N-acetylmuramoyl-L-alanine amidase [Bartonella sp. F02]
MYPIDYNSYRSIKSFNRRVRFLVMHYTSIDFKASIAALTGELVSSHYLVPDPTEQTYIEAGFKEMRIFNLVDEVERAWHAGVSSWAGRSNLNDTSIGIEIVNLASCRSCMSEKTKTGGDDKNEYLLNPIDKNQSTDSRQSDMNDKALNDPVVGSSVESFNNEILDFPPYNPIQIEAVKQLALNIIQRYPEITPVNVVGHSDIAIGRKSDPGAAFPWKELYEAGIGAWYDDTVKNDYVTQFSKKMPTPADVMAKLNQYGYDISAAGTESGYKNLLRAFQLHFRPERYDGILDTETAAIAYALVDKYFS